MLGNQFAVDLDRLHVQQHEQHPAWLLFIQVLPLVHAAPVDTCPSNILVVSKGDRYELKKEREKKHGARRTGITRKHHSLLAAVERKLKLPLDNNPIVDRQGTVDRRLYAGSKVNQTSDAAVGNMN